MSTRKLTACPVAVEWGAGRIARLRRHRNLGLEIVWVDRGRLRWEVEGREHAVAPDSMFFTFPHERHGSLDDFEPGHHWYFVVIGMHGGGLSRMLGLSRKEEREVLAALHAARSRVVPATPELREWMPRLVAELQANGTWSSAWVAALARLILLALARGVAMGKTAAPVGPQVRVRRLLEALAADPARPWPVGEMASMCGLRRTWLAKLIEEQTGDSPHRYVMRLRVRRAQQLLHETVRSITDIAHDCGFSSSQHFARVFHGFTEITPTEYRCAGQGSGVVSRK